jgi:peptidoglycan/LPS O-acetylase OafA/YrhL
MLQAKKQHFLALDSLRGICATFVVFYHFEGDSLIKAVPFIKHAFLFVDFFFVLSGFVIASSYGARLAGGFPVYKFMLLRLGRLYPLHAIVLIAYLAIAAAKHFSDPGYNGPDFFLSAFLLQVWAHYDVLDMNHWNPPSWSISAELWTYLMFAAVVSICGKQVWSIFAGLIAISFMLLSVSSDRYIDVCFSGGGFVRCVFGFSFGVVAYLAYENELFTAIEKAGLGVPTTVECVLVAVCLLLVSEAGAGALSLACPAIFSILVLIFASEKGALSQLLLSFPMRKIGSLSYSIYMVHQFVLARFVNGVSLLGQYVKLPVELDPSNHFALNSSGFAFGSDVAAIAAYCLVLVVSYCTYSFVETPCRRWSRQRVWSK